MKFPDGTIPEIPDPEGTFTKGSADTFPFGRGEVEFRLEFTLPLCSQAINRGLGRGRTRKNFPNLALEI